MLNEKIVSKFVRLLNESDGERIELTDKKIDILNANDYNPKNVVSTKSYIGKLQGKNIDRFYFSMGGTTVKEIDFMGGSLDIVNWGRLGSSKIEKGVIKNFKNIIINGDKTTLKDITFENGDSVTIMGSAVKFRKLHLKNVNHINFTPEGNIGKIQITFENCKDILIRCGRDIVCDIDKLIFDRCDVRTFDFGKYRDKVKVTKLISHKTKLSQSAERGIHEAGDRAVFSRHINSLADAIKTKDAQTIIIE